MIYVVLTIQSNFCTLPGDCFVFPPISAILGAFLTICFQLFGVLLFLAHCSPAPAVITSRRPNRHPGSTFQLAGTVVWRKSWRSRGLVTASRDPTYASPNVRSGGPRWDQMGGGGVNFHPKLQPQRTSKCVEVRYCSSPSLGLSVERGRQC